MAFCTGKLCVALGAKSNIWQHFIVLESGLFSNRAECNHCNVLVARGASNSPTNLTTHLKQHHKDLYNAGLLSTMMQEGPMDTFLDQGKDGCFKDAFCHWLVHDMQPLSVGKSAGFCAVVSTGGHKVMVPEQ